MGAAFFVVGGDEVVVGVDVGVDSPEGTLVGTVVVGRVVVGRDVDDGATLGSAVVADLTPGCSLATTTPISTLAPLAVSAADLVRRRRRDLARCLAPVALYGCVEFIRWSAPSDLLAGTEPSAIEPPAPVGSPMVICG